MKRRVCVMVIWITLLPSLLVAQDGKLRGTIIDKENGEPLVAANVVVQGTTIGASTDNNGDYVILSVPPGTYTIQASYIGYATETISNIRVSANLTTTQDFELSIATIQIPEVVVFSTRPLIQHNTTNTIRIQTQRDIQELPFRGLQNILALNAGVVQQNGQIYIRGGRAGEVSYFVDGATATNPLFNSEAISPIQEAIEEIQLQSGGYTAEFGGSNSAIVRTTLRTGSAQNFKVTVDFQTDDFSKPGKQFLGTSSRGYRNAVVTLGGPLVSNLQYFIAGQHNYLRNRNHMYLEPFVFDDLTTDAFDLRMAGIPLPGPVEIKRNYLYNNWRNENTIQGTLLWNVQPFKIRFSGSYTNIDLPTGGDWPNALTNIFWRRSFRNETNSYLMSVHVTHILNPKTFYEIGVSYLKYDFRAYDPDFSDDWKLYSDSIAFRNRGYILSDGTTGFLTRHTGPPSYSTINAFEFTHENAPNNMYQRNEQNNIGMTIDFTSQVNSNWEIKVGGHLDAWTMRLFSVTNISKLNGFLETSGDNYTQDKLAADPSLAKEYTLTVQNLGNMNLYGYDIEGNKVDDGLDGPRKPLFASAYVQNKFEFSDLVVNAGMRYELFDMKNIAPIDYVNPEWDDNLNYFVRDDQLKETDPVHLLLPRVSFSFPVTDRTVFYSMFGKYAQLPALNRLYTDSRILAAHISPRTRTTTVNATGGGFLVKPERTTQYEIGFRQTLSDNFAFTLTGFYKDLRDLTHISVITNDDGVDLFSAYENKHFGTVKGMELTLELRRTNRLQGRVNYTLSDARGTSSTPNSSRFALFYGSSARSPAYINPLDYDQTHRGSILLDYRWAKGDGGSFLEGFGVAVLVTFNSGHAYTKIKEPQNLGQSNPWNIGTVAIRSDGNPEEPVNSSTTPWVFNVDLNVSKVLYLEGLTVELYANILNLFDTKHILNVFQNTGSPTDDGWLRSPFALSFLEIPNYANFYRAINLQNRYAYIGATGNDIYGTPRELRVGLKLEI